MKLKGVMEYLQDETIKKMLDDVYDDYEGNIRYLDYLKESLSWKQPSMVFELNIELVEMQREKINQIDDVINELLAELEERSN